MHKLQTEPTTNPQAILVSIYAWHAMATSPKLYWDSPEYEMYGNKEEGLDQGIELLQELFPGVVPDHFYASLDELASANFYCPLCVVDNMREEGEITDNDCAQCPMSKTWSNNTADSVPCEREDTPYRILKHREENASPERREKHVLAVIGLMIAALKTFELTFLETLAVHALTVEYEPYVKKGITHINLPEGEPSKTFFYED